MKIEMERLKDEVSFYDEEQHAIHIPEEDVPKFAAYIWNKAQSSSKNLEEDCVLPLSSNPESVEDGARIIMLWILDRLKKLDVEMKDDQKRIDAEQLDHALLASQSFRSIMGNRANFDLASLIRQKDEVSDAP